MRADNIYEEVDPSPINEAVINNEMKEKMGMTVRKKKTKVTTMTKKMTKPLALVIMIDHRS